MVSTKPAAAQEAMLRNKVTDAGALHLSRLGPGVNGVHSALLDVLKALSQFGYDRMYWLEDRNFDELVSDPLLRKFLVDRLPIVSQFEATLTELFVWGWLKVRGLSPTLQEQTGQPDLRLMIAGQPIYGDVKAMMPGTQISRVKAILQKANKQIKQGGAEASGLCFLRIVEPQLQRPDRDGTDKVPPHVALVIEALKSELQKPFNASVGQVIVIWEQHTLTGDIPGWINVLGTRNAEVLLHAHPRGPVLENGDLAPKATIAFNVRIQGADLPGTLWRRRP
jgi:hypothetical protein